MSSYQSEYPCSSNDRVKTKGQRQIRFIPFAMPAQLAFPSQSSLSSTTLDLSHLNGGDLFDSDTDPSEEVLGLFMMIHMP